MLPAPSKKAVTFSKDVGDEADEDLTEHFRAGALRRSNTLFSSRRSRPFDDDQSQDEGEASSAGELEAGSDLRLNTLGETVENKPNPRFKNYPQVFKNLLKHSPVSTQYPICSMIITYDSTKAITVTKRDDKEYYVQQYDLESYEMTFAE